MRTPEVEAFRVSAARFCSLIERIDDVGSDEATSALHRALAEVYAAATRLRPGFSDAGQLPDISPDANSEVLNRLLSTLGSDEYSFVFDPWGDDELVQSRVADDLAEVYTDLKTVLADDRGESGAWDWCEGFDRHWGRHAEQALHALH